VVFLRAIHRAQLLAITVITHPCDGDARRLDASMTSERTLSCRFIHCSCTCRSPLRTWILAIVLQGLLVGSGLAALRSGEAEEDRVERLVPETAIEAHEEAAELFLIGAGTVLAIALGAMLIPRDRSARAVATLAALGTLGVLGLGYRTGKAGGELVYRHDAAAAYASDRAGAPPSSSRQLDEEGSER
jgi:hypothetical protein